MKLTILIIAISIILSCGESDSDIKTPKFTFECSLKDSTSPAIAEKLLISMLKNNSYAVEIGDHSSLIQISGRPGYVFHLWISKHGETIATITNIKNEKILDLVLYENKTLENIIDITKNVCVS